MRSIVFSALLVFLAINANAQKAETIVNESAGPEAVKQSGAAKNPGRKGS